MQLRCIKPFGLSGVGDVVEAADGGFDPEHWELAGPPPSAGASPASAALAEGAAALAALTGKEM